MTPACFKEGECVKHIVAFEGGFPNKGKMIWRPAVVVRVIDFGYEILCQGEIKEVQAMDLEKIDDTRGSNESHLET